ncbi:hypothetical protein QEH56_24530, partial [Pelagicoccus enzymogenes]|uniref:hypothetical protein n=1 Tax=Pelagicoccus enzymogenes TaxID=2773457 RepID=UPI002810051D
VMQKCIRCETKLKSDGRGSWKVKFYRCPNCGSGYSKTLFKPLCDRWLMPITIPLYSVIFDKEPEQKSYSVARTLLNQNDKKEIRQIIEHIDEEIKHPKQKISDILNFIHPNEDKLRRFLKCVSIELKEQTKA